MNKLNLLFVVVFLAFAGFACSDSGDAEMSSDIYRDDDEPRYARTFPPTPEPTVQPDNSPDYWTKWYNKEQYDEDYTSLVPQTEADLAEDFKMATEAEERLDGKAEVLPNISEVNYAFTFYSRAALGDEKHLPRAVLNLERGIKYEAESTDLAQNTLALLQKYPDNKKLKSFLPDIRRLLLEDLKRNDHFDVNKSYAKPESWWDDKVYGQGVYAIYNIVFLGRIAKKTGDKAGYTKWQRYIAEYELTGHTFDGEYTDNDPSISYEIYTQLGDLVSAKKAANLMAQKYLEVYLQGAHTIMGDPKRSHGLPHDLKQAKAWFKKGGLMDKRIEAIISEQARKEIDDINDCIGKECGAYEVRKLFLESISS